MLPDEVIWYKRRQAESSFVIESICDDEGPSPLAEVGEEETSRSQTLPSRSKRTRRCWTLANMLIRTLARTLVRQKPSTLARSEPHYWIEATQVASRWTLLAKIDRRMKKIDPTIWQRCIVLSLYCIWSCITCKNGGVFSLWRRIKCWAWRKRRWFDVW